MADYISREALAAHFRRLANEARAVADAFSDAAAAVENFPAADVEPVRHGRWVPSKIRNEIERCSKCGKVFRHPSFYGYHFCPSCGAKMDLEDEK